MLLDDADRLEGVLSLFAEAQELYAPTTFAANHTLPDAFIVPKKGKSGLSRHVNTPEERKEKRAAIARAKYARDMADPAKAEHIRHLTKLRLAKLRQRKAAAK